MKLRAALLAILVASIGGLLVWSYLRKFEEEASGGTRVGVLAVLRTLEPGAPIRNEDLAERWIPQAYVESRAVRVGDRPRIVNLRVSTPLDAQQVLMWTDIVVANDDQRAVSGLVQPGMRAVTIRAEGKASSLVHPGDRVDVLATFSQPGSGDQRAAVVLLQNVLVLGRGNEPSSGAARTSTDGSDLALSLSLQNAQVLAVASDKGKLSVALRSPEDLRIQEGLVDISSSILVEPEKRAAAVRSRPGPTRMDSVVR